MDAVIVRHAIVFTARRQMAGGPVVWIQCFVGYRFTLHTIFHTRNQQQEQTRNTFVDDENLSDYHVDDRFLILRIHISVRPQLTIFYQ